MKLVLISSLAVLGLVSLTIAVPVPADKEHGRLKREGEVADKVDSRAVLADVSLTSTHADPPTEVNLGVGKIVFGPNEHAVEVVVGAGVRAGGEEITFLEEGARRKDPNVEVLVENHGQHQGEQHHPGDSGDHKEDEQGQHHSGDSGNHREDEHRRGDEQARVDVKEERVMEDPNEEIEGKRGGGSHEQIGVMNVEMKEKEIESKRGGGSHEQIGIMGVMEKEIESKRGGGSHEQIGVMNLETKEKEIESKRGGGSHEQMGIMGVMEKEIESKRGGGSHEQIGVMNVETKEKEIESKRGSSHEQMDEEEKRVAPQMRAAMEEGMAEARIQFEEGVSTFQETRPIKKIAESVQQESFPSNAAQEVLVSLDESASDFPETEFIEAVPIEAPIEVGAAIFSQASVPITEFENIAEVFPDEASVVAAIHQVPIETPAEVGEIFISQTSSQFTEPGKITEVFLDEASPVSIIEHIPVETPVEVGATVISQASVIPITESEQVAHVFVDGAPAAAAQIFTSPFSGAETTHEVQTAHQTASTFSSIGHSFFGRTPRRVLREVDLEEFQEQLRAAHDLDPDDVVSCTVHKRQPGDASGILSDFGQFGTAFSQFFSSGFHNPFAIVETETAAEDEVLGRSPMGAGDNEDSIHLATIFADDEEAAEHAVATMMRILDRSKRDLETQQEVAVESVLEAPPAAAEVDAEVDKVHPEIIDDEVAPIPEQNIAAPVEEEVVAAEELEQEIEQETPASPNLSQIFLTTLVNSIQAIAETMRTSVPHPGHEATFTSAKQQLVRVIKEMSPLIQSAFSEKTVSVEAVKQMLARLNTALDGIHKKLDTISYQTASSPFNPTQAVAIFHTFVQAASTNLNVPAQVVAPAVLGKEEVEIEAVAAM